MARKHAPQIKDSRTYDALIDQGASPEKAARIANARAAGTLDHRSTRLETRTRADLYAEAKRIGITGRSAMTKAELIAAIRAG